MENPRGFSPRKSASEAKDIPEVFRGIEDLDGTLAGVTGKFRPRSQHILDSFPAACQIVDKAKAALGGEKFSRAGVLGNDRSSHGQERRRPIAQPAGAPRDIDPF